MMMMVCGGVWWDDDGKQGEGFGRPRAKDLAGLHPERHGEANWHFLRRGASQGVGPLALGLLRGKKWASGGSASRPLQRGARVKPKPRPSSPPRRV